MSDRIQRIFLYGLVALLIAGTGLALRFAQRYRPVAGLVPTTPANLPTDIGLRFEGVTVVGRGTDGAAWTVQAPLVDATRARNRLDFSGGIRATVLWQNKPRVALTAPTATFDVTERRLTAAGSVEARLLPRRRGERPVVARTGLASWEIGTSLLRCPQTVTVTLGDIGMEGRNLEANLKTQAFRLQGARGSAPLEEDLL